MESGAVRLFIKFSIQRSTIIRALKVTAVVTPILTIFNHSQEIMDMNFGPAFFLQAFLTFCVPYMVSTYSSAMTEIANKRLAPGEAE